MTKFQNLLRREEFLKDLKKLSRKYPTLEADLEIFMNVQLFSYHKLGIDNQGIERIPGLGFDNPPIYKATKFACRSLKGKGARSGIRIIYCYHQELDKVEFIEIYYKEKDDTKEDKDRIKRLYGKTLPQGKKDKAGELL